MAPQHTQAKQLQNFISLRVLAPVSHEGMLWGFVGISCRKYNQPLSLPTEKMLGECADIINKWALLSGPYNYIFIPEWQALQKVLHKEKWGGGGSNHMVLSCPKTIFFEKTEFLLLNSVNKTGLKFHLLQVSARIKLISFPLNTGTLLMKTVGFSSAVV